MAKQRLVHRGVLVGQGTPNDFRADAGVAVIVTTFEQREFLAEALASAVTEQPREIVVVDDGSSEPVDDIVATFPGVRLHRQRNEGVASARNTGLRLTSAPRVVFLDADDRLVAGALTAGASSLDAHPDAAFASGASRCITADGRPLGDVMTWQPRTANLYVRLLRRPYICPPSAAMFRREAIREVGPWREDPDLWGVEDWDLYLRLARSFPIVSHGRLVADYRLHSGQSSLNSARMLHSIETLLQREGVHTKGQPLLERARLAGLRYWRVRLKAEIATKRFRDAGTQQSRRPQAVAALACLRWRPLALGYRAPSTRLALAVRGAAAGKQRHDVRGVPPVGAMPSHGAGLA